MPQHKRRSKKQLRRPTKRTYLNTIINQARHSGQPVIIIWDDIHLFHIPATFHIVYAIQAPTDHVKQLIIRLPNRIPILTIQLTHGQLRITNLRDNAAHYLCPITAKDALLELYQSPTNHNDINIDKLIAKHITIHQSKENDDNCEALLYSMGTDPHHTTTINIQLYRRKLPPPHPHSPKTSKKEI